MVLLTVGAGYGSAARALEIRYTLRPAKKALESATDEERLGLLEKLNRIERDRLGRLDKVVVPSRWDGEELNYSPLPRRVDVFRGERKVLVVHQPRQVFGAYKAGELVRWGPVNTGRRDRPTPSGVFHLTWRSRGHHSTVNSAWYLKWYFNFENRRGLSLHSYALPGLPVSHACVRLLERDAHWVYDWGEPWKLDERGWEILAAGTPLWIVGSYNYDAPPPWLAPDHPHPQIGLPLADFRRARSQAAGGDRGLER